MSIEKWILGLDSRTGAEGPLVFASWLSARLGGTQSAILEPIHVMERDELELLANVHKRELFVGLAEDAVARTLARAGVKEGIPKVRIVEVGEPENVLTSAADEAGGLIIGRLAPRGKDQLVRLGSVGRRCRTTGASAICRRTS